MAAEKNDRIDSEPESVTRTPSEELKNEKTTISLDEDGVNKLEGHLGATEDDILEAKAAAESLTLETVVKMMKRTVKLHEGDPNFPFDVMQRIKTFLANEDALENPGKYEQLIQEMKLEAALITSNSPYAEVRSVVDNHDDPSMPVSTIRSWVLGLFFAGLISFINQLFSIRLPPIALTGDVAQLLSYPLGKAWDRWMPNWHIKIPFLKEPLQLNPGPFNKKEHMLIAIMAQVSLFAPYSNYIFWVQYLPIYFNQSYASSFGYMITNNLATIFIGYGLAGLVRRFLVYPSFCVWPASLVTVALNSALHQEDNTVVLGPFKKMWHMSRYKFFMIAFGAMFVYFWIPNYLFLALSTFAWMTWIAPNNLNLNVLTGMGNGLGLLNPIPTFDWNIVSFLLDPLMYPSFTTFNTAAGMFFMGLMMMALWYTNSYNTAHLPLNSNKAYDHFGMPYNVTMVIDERGFYVHEQFMEYSFPYLSPGLIISYFCFFCVYSAVLTHIVLNHRYEVTLGFKSLFKDIPWPGKKKNREDNGDEDWEMDVHARLMKAYKEVPEFWYLTVLLISIALGVTGLAVWPTYTSPAVPLYGVALCILFVVPVGIVTAMTGLPISLNILAEFFGGLAAEGNALALNYFKCYGFVTCFQTVNFSNDLKLAHYLKIPPRVTFSAQIAATFLCTFISTATMVFQMNLENVCTPLAPMKFLCPALNSFFTASILWGTIGPRKTFGAGAPYQWLLLGFPIGFLTVLIFWGLRKAFPNVKLFRQMHLVAFFMGGVNWGIYNFSYIWPAVPVAWLSWHYIRGRYLALWAKYNFVLSAALSAAMALSAVLMFFTVSWTETDLVWWGNTQPYVGCEGVPCILKPLQLGERFFPWWDLKQVPSA